MSRPHRTNEGQIAYLTNQTEKNFQASKDAALEAVQFMVRQVLRRCPELHEFIMANGGAFFIKDNSSNITIADLVTVLGNEVPCRSEAFFAAARLLSFMGTWDAVLKITGNPMRFTTEGPIVTDW